VYSTKHLYLGAILSFCPARRHIALIWVKFGYYSPLLPSVLLPFHSLPIPFPIHLSLYSILFLSSPISFPSHSTFLFFFSLFPASLPPLLILLLSSHSLSFLVFSFPVLTFPSPFFLPVLFRCCLLFTLSFSSPSLHSFFLLSLSFSSSPFYTWKEWDRYGHAANIVAAW